MAKSKKRRPTRQNRRDTDAPRDDATPRPYAIFLASAAVRALDRLTRPAFLRIDAKIQALSDDPRPPGCSKLQGVADLYRIRAGDFRIVYEIKDAELVILVVHVGDRKDVYRNL